MKRAIISGLAGALLFLFASEPEAGASDRGSKDLCTIILVGPFFTTTYPISTSAEASAGSSNESRAPTTRSEESSPASHDFSKGTSDDSRRDSRESSNSSSSAKENAPRKLIVPWRARSEAASLLASPQKASPSALLRSILTRLRQQQLAAGPGGRAVPTDRMLAAQLVALPPEQG
jgi:hypothetical protein